MHLDGSHADIQTAGDVTVRISLRHQFENLFLPRGQSVRPLAPHGCGFDSLDWFPLPGCRGGFSGLLGLLDLRAFAWCHKNVYPKILLKVILAYLGKSVKTITSPRYS